MQRALAISRSEVGILALARSSSLLFGGAAAARLLGFLFSVAAARLLVPARFGDLSYALAIAAVASTLVSAAPVGLSRFLARHREARREQSAYFSTWVAAVTLVAAASAVVATPVALLLGNLGGWLVAGVVANIAGVAVLQFYLEARRGIESYGLLTAFWVLANLLQLAGILAAAALGLRSPAVFLGIYAVSSLFALAVIQPVAPFPVRLVPALVTRRRLREVMRFISPILVQSVCYGVWFSADLIAVQRLLSASATGQYAAAKTIANAVTLVPWSVGIVVLPRAARLAPQALRRSLLEVLGLTTLAALPVAAVVILNAPWLVALLFTSRYAGAAGPLAALTLGGIVYSYAGVIGSFWIGRGHPGLDAWATAAAMVATVLCALLLVPREGTIGAAIAFGAGSGMRLLVVASLTPALIRSSLRSSAAGAREAPAAG